MHLSDSIIATSCPPFPMTDHPTPRQIVETLFPPLKLAAAYARQIQSKISAQPEKTQAENPFSAALTDADLSIQTFVEVALLGTFPQIRFFGEEFEKSYNTKYFRSIELGQSGDYLVTLDPIDGTRFYMDGHSNYQIILTVLDTESFAAAIAITPAENYCTYAIRGEGTFAGALSDELHQFQPLVIGQPKNQIFLGSKVGQLAPHLRDRYTVIDILADYAADRPTPNVNGLLTGELTGAVLASGKWIDSAALAFMAQEAGYLLTTWEGSPLPPLFTCEDYQWPGLVIASSKTVQSDLLAAVQKIK
jgi:myo-inositol-1(or 4)-monophosphatase